jgi:hypothetical protein
MPSDDPSADELEDARLLYAFGKTQAFHGDRELAGLAVVIAGDLAGQQFGRISESCGWARKELFGLCLECWDNPSVKDYRERRS